jgi:hypothetical protein
MPQQPESRRELDRQRTTTKLLLRIIVVLLVPLTLVVLKRYGVV